MSDPGEEGLQRARQELAAAELLAGHGFDAQAVSRSYYAAFYAAETALLELGESRAKHSGVVSAFGQILIRDRQLDEQAGRLLRSLFERRSQADYQLAPVPPEEAASAVDDARVVVKAVSQWLAERRFTGQAVSSADDEDLFGTGAAWELR